MSNAETEEERQARHLDEDLQQSFPPIYHDMVRVLIKKAVINERHRCAKATLDFASALARDPNEQAKEPLSKPEGPGA